MVTHKRRGSALSITIIVLMVIFTLGSALLSLTTSTLMRSKNDLLRSQALDVTEAGVEKAIYYVRNTAPDGSVNGSWRTNGVTETISGAGTYTFSVTNGTGDDAGRLVLICTGQASMGAKTTTRRLRVVFTRGEENISPWANVIFGGVGQTGQSINGNIVMRGSLHLLGDGEPFTDVDNDQHWDNDEPYTDTNGNGHYDLGEPYTDTDGDGHRDSREPFVDMNGNGTCDPPLTVTDLASEMSGTANLGNNYDGMSSTLHACIPACPTATFGGESVQSLTAKLRAKHGRVDISGTATVGQPNATGGSPALKETMNGAYVSDGYGGNQGASQVYSDNGTSHSYDLQNLISFPDVIATPTAPIHGVVYATHMDYLTSSDEGLQITPSGGTLNLQPDQTYSASDGYGNSISIDGQGRISIQGIVCVHGDISLNRGQGSSNGRFTYSGRGTLASTGSIYVHTDVLPATTFPATDAMGFVARRHLELATGSGDSQLTMAGAFYAQEQVVSQKQNELAGTFVSSYYSMQNVPHMYQVPTLTDNLPPGMPGATPIWVVNTKVISWREIAPA